MPGPQFGVIFCFFLTNLCVDFQSHCVVYVCVCLCSGRRIAKPDHLASWDVKTLSRCLHRPRCSAALLLFVLYYPLSDEVWDLHGEPGSELKNSKTHNSLHRVTPNQFHSRKDVAEDSLPAPSGEPVRILARSSPTAA